jgi:hypothetical protein
MFFFLLLCLMTATSLQPSDTGFLAGTCIWVHLPPGGKCVPIETIQDFDRIIIRYLYDDNVCALGSVNWLTELGNAVEITFQGAPYNIQAGAEEGFSVTGKGWVNASDLQPGDQIMQCCNATEGYYVATVTPLGSQELYNIGLMFPNQQLYVASIFALCASSGF